MGEHLLAAVFAIERFATQALQAGEKAGVVAADARVWSFKSGSFRRLAQRPSRRLMLGEHLFSERPDTRMATLRQRSSSGSDFVAVRLGGGVRELLWRWLLGAFVQHHGFPCPPPAP